MNNSKNKNILIVVLLAIVLIMAVGYAAFRASLNINGTANITSIWDVKITNIETSVYGSATSTSSSYTDTSATISANLVSPGDYVDYVITVTNGGNISAKLDTLTGPTSNNDAVEITRIGGLLQGDIILKGQSDTITIRIKYNDQVTSQPESTSAQATVTMSFSQYVDKACVAKGSKISMADGTQKNIEYVKTDDEVLSYDYYNGIISKTKVMAVWSGKSKENVFTVKLENGSSLQIVDSEYLFDTDTKQYILVNKNDYQSIIGKNVMVNNDGDIGYSKIISITYEIKEIEHYTMYTDKTINYIANNMIALIPLNFVNARYTIKDDYKIDMDKYNDDVKKYGIYKYKDLKDVCTEETFNSFGLKDFKIVVEKSSMTFEEFKDGIKILQDEIDYYNFLQ